MAGETTLLITNSGRFGQETARALRKRNVCGLIMAPPVSNSGEVHENPPEGWAHLKGDMFEVETMLATARAAHHIIFVGSHGDGDHFEEMELISSLADTLEESNGNFLLVREQSFELKDEASSHRESTMLKRIEEMLSDRSLRTNFNLAILSLPHIYGPGLEARGLQQRLISAAEGQPYTWPGKPIEEPQIMHVNDGATAIAAAFQRARRGGERLWVSGDAEVTMKSLADMVAEMTGGLSKVSWPNVSFLETLKGTYRKPSRPRAIGKILPGTEISEEINARKPLGEGLRETLLAISVNQRAPS